jgi:RHS repeat-associated protein
MEPLPGRTCVLVLSYAQQRWYDPRTGRFLSEDPVGVTDERLGMPSGLQTFAYASANPLRYVDPLGLESLSGDPDMRRMREERQKWYAATSDACQAGHASACVSLKADETPGFMKPFLYPMFGLTALAIGAPVAASATPTMLTEVGAAGGGAVVAEKATMLGLLGMAAHACWDAPSLQTCGTAIGMAMLGRAAKTPSRPGAAQQPKPAAVPGPALTVEAQALVERTEIAATAAEVPVGAPALSQPAATGQQSATNQNVTPRDLFAFGNKSGPRPPRAVQDFGVEGPTSKVGPEAPPLPKGASTFGDVEAAPLTGHYHRLPAGTKLPAGMCVIPDGCDVVRSSPHPPTHSTIYPVVETTVQEFGDWFQALPWQYGGKK